jgi:hypothetical protein
MPNLLEHNIFEKECLQGKLSLQKMPFLYKTVYILRDVEVFSIKNSIK